MENKFITKEELQQLQSIQQSNNQIILELGKIELEKIKLNQRRYQVKQYLESLEQDSQTLSEFLQHKYGKCSINIDTGEITPIV